MLVGSGDEQGFCYFLEDDAATAQTAMRSLDAYVDENGPFDGVMAFSQSVGLVGTWLLSRQRRRLASVRCAVFFSGGSTPVDPDVLGEGILMPLPVAGINKAVAEVITIPTAHIYGSADPYSASAASFAEVCREDASFTFIHPGAHEVPGSGSGSSSKDVLNHTVNTIRRVIMLAA